VRAVFYGEIENKPGGSIHEIPVSNEPTNITMKFTAFQELFEEQRNMVHFRNCKTEASLLMTKKTNQFIKLNSTHFTWLILILTLNNQNNP
jgi:hypothetical protein